MRRFVKRGRAIAAFILVSKFAIAGGDFFEGRVQTPELKAPERGSIAGQLSQTVFGPSDVNRGAMTLPSPFDVPEERGPIQGSPFPLYSQESGISEWGLGWRANVMIRRSRLRGDVDYGADDFDGPWGRMIKGADGAFYPQGMSPPVRVMVSGETLVAYLPDGARWTFGGDARVTSPRGTYAWYLSSVVNATGRSTRFSYIANASGRQFIKSVAYGGASDNAQVRVEFDYEILKQPFSDYRSGRAVLLDRRVSAVRVSMNAGASFAPRWSYALGYQNDSTGPAFFLTSVQKSFASGATDPPTTYNYAQQADHFASTTPREAPAVTKLAKQLQTRQFLPPTFSTAVDVDLDGRVDLELAFDNQTLVQRDDSFEVVPAPPNAAAIERGCRFRPSAIAPARVLARVTPTDAEPRVWATESGASDSNVKICRLDGSALYTSIVKGVWGLGATTRLADLNRDGKPDFIRVGEGRYFVLPNTSSGDAVSFGPTVRGELQPAFTPDAVWIEDANGDGLGDLIASVGGNVVIWNATGPHTFEERGKTFRFFDGPTELTNLADYDILWFDANKDGLVDALLSTGTSYYLYTNRGDSFQRVKLPALSQLSLAATKPVPLDLVGSGNTEFIYFEHSAAKTVAIDSAGASLLASVNDGKGTEISFRYGRAAASRGIRSRPTVLKELDIKRVGYAPVTYEFNYAQPTVHSVGHFLVGFDTVVRRGALETNTMSFRNDDRTSGLLLSSIVADALAPTVEQVAYREYEDATLAGLPWARLKSSGEGFRSTDPIAPRVLLETTTIGAYSQGVCPRDIELSTSHGTRKTNYTYASIAAFSRHFSCFSATTRVRGEHTDARFNFDHSARIERDARGLPTTIALLGPDEPVVVQNVTYTDDGLVESISSPAKGEVRASYDASTRLLASVTAADGVTQSVTDRDRATDAVREITTDRGSLKLHQRFRYDSRERLASRWDDLGAATEAKPNARITYRYASTSENTAGLIQVETLVRGGASPVVRRSAELLTAGGESIATGGLIPEGWLLGSIAARDPSVRRTELFRGSPIHGDIASLRIADAIRTAASVGSSTHSLFGATVESTTQFHQDARRIDRSTFSLGGDLVVATTENGLFSTSARYDAAKRTTESKDASGASWKYRYDALGRLREVTLPGGQKQFDKYDAYARRSAVVREGLLQIDYTFDRLTGDVSDVKYSASSGGAMRSVHYARDGIGRVTVETHRDEQAKSDLRYQYYFDGSSPDEPKRRDNLGLLTGVHGPGYYKRFDYRADGSMRRFVFTVDGFGELDTSFRFDDDGAVRGRAVAAKGSDGKLISAVTTETTRDAFGRASGTLLQGGEFASYGYDKEGSLDWAQFANGDVVTFQYDRLTRERVGLNQNSGAWASANSRRMNNRGLIAHEDIDVAGDRRRRAYTYGPEAYLTAAKDERESFGYQYSPSGEVASSASLTRDRLGRVDVVNGWRVTYGPNGHIQTANRGGRTLRYLYDESGLKIAKFEQEKPAVMFPADGSMFDSASGLIEPVSVEGQVVGFLHHGISGAAPRFEMRSVDARDTILSNGGGAANFASPYGARAEHPAHAQAIDFARKGYDSDIGTLRIGVRDYDPATGLFLQPDALYLETLSKCVESPVSCNLYSYGKNNPLSHIDPSGSDAVDIRARQLEAAFAKDFESGMRMAEARAVGAIIGASIALAAPAAASAQALGLSVAVRVPGAVEAATALVAGLNEAAGAVGTGAALATAGAVGNAIASEVTVLYRGVVPAELASIEQTGKFLNLGSVEGKFFSKTAEGVTSFARYATAAFKDPPYTLVRTEILTRQLTPEMLATVDRGIPAVVIPNDTLPQLAPTIVPFMVLPK